MTKRYTIMLDLELDEAVAKLRLQDEELGPVEWDWPLLLDLRSHERVIAVSVIEHPSTDEEPSDALNR